MIVSERNLPRRMFGTTAVARILNVEDWIVKGFGQEPYNLLPERMGEGRGKKRLYTFRQVLQIDVAHALSRKSQLFNSDLIPAAVGLITDDLIRQWVNSYDAEGTAPPLVLTFDGQGWEILSKKQCTADFEESLRDGNIWVSLNLVPFWEATVQRIGELESNGEI